MNMNTHPMSRITRLAVTLVLGILLLSSVSCSAPDFGSRAKENAAAIEKLESRFNELENGLGGVVFWQALAAVFFVLAGFRPRRWSGARFTGAARPRPLLRSRGGHRPSPEPR